MLVDYFRLSFSSLLQRRLRSWLTMIGIFIGIAAVVGLISLGQGMRDAVAGQFTSLGVDTISIQSAGGGFGPPGTYAATLISEDDLRVVKRARGVENAFGRLIEPISLEFDGKQDNGFLVSISDDVEEYELSIILPTEFKAETGRLIKPSDCNKLMIGNDLHSKPRFGREMQLNDKVIIEGKTFDVVGILEKTGNPQLDITFFAPETCVRDATGEDEKFGLIVAKAAADEDVGEVVEHIEKGLRKSRDVEEGKEDFVVETSQELLESLDTILGIVQAVLIGIAAISLLVGGVGITNTMYTAVLERTKEIGIMKAIGARNSDVSALFLIESGLLGMTGGAIGALLGIGLALSVERAAQVFWGTVLIEAHISSGLIIGALVFSFLIGSLSGFMPARQASRMKPVEALRYG